MGRPNLTVLTRAQVRRLTFEGDRVASSAKIVFGCASRRTSDYHRAIFALATVAAASFNAGETAFDPTAATELGIARARDGGTAVDCDGGGKLLCRNVTLVCEEV